jgi:hypothetical protein
MTDAYDPYEYFIRMARRHGGNWNALFLTPSTRHRSPEVRTLFAMLEDRNMPSRVFKTKHLIVTENGATATFKVAYDGIFDQLAGNEYQQIDGTDYLTSHDQERIRTLLRTQVSLALAKDMAIR